MSVAGVSDKGKPKVKPCVPDEDAVEERHKVGVEVVYDDARLGTQRRVRRQQRRPPRGRRKILGI